MQVLEDQGADGVAVIGLLSRQHLVEDHAQTVEIRASVGLHPLRLFRAQIVGCSDDGAGTGQIGAFADALRDPEVRQRHAVVLPEHDIGRFEVTMHDARIVDGF